MMGNSDRLANHREAWQLYFVPGECSFYFPKGFTQYHFFRREVRPEWESREQFARSIASQGTLKAFGPVVARLLRNLVVVPDLAGALRLLKKCSLETRISN